jgi:hypothetical protein
MITSDFILGNLALVKSQFVDPVRVENGDYREEWTCCAGTEFQVCVLVEDVPVAWPTMGDSFLMTSSERQKLEADRIAESDSATRRRVAEAVAEAMSVWSAHKKLRLVAAIQQAWSEAQ